MWAGAWLLSLLAGCSRETYPANLRYPVRSGLLVTAAPVPPTPPERFDTPGELDHILAKLDPEPVPFDAAAREILEALEYGGDEYA